MGALSNEWTGTQVDARLQLELVRRELAEKAQQLAAQNDELTAKDERIRELEEQALMDPLTGLMNRRGLDDFYMQEKARLARHTSSGALFVLIDLDRFKAINDKFGHQAGDACLEEVSRKLRASVRILDCPARLGGDEFVLIISQIDPAQASHKLEELRQALDKMSIPWNGSTLDFGASVGGALMKSDSAYEDIYQQADEDLYSNKEQRHARMMQELNQNGERTVVPIVSAPHVREAFRRASKRACRPAPGHWITGAARVAIF
jgi:two-component system cell cycle response regulator